MPTDEARAPLVGLRVCICTPDYVSLVRNGGIGTSFHHTAQELSKLGADVTVLFASTIDSMSHEELEKGLSKLSLESAKFELLFSSDMETERKYFLPGDVFTVTSYLAYRWLKEREYDIIIFPDWRGIAYFSLHAKVQGLAFKKTSIWVQAHSTMLWHALNNEASNYSELEVRAFHMERKSIELCDVLISPTQYLLTWMETHGFSFPKSTYVLPYLISGEAAAAPVITRPVDEIVFYGRLEKRKGLHIFLQALRRIKISETSRHLLDGVTITFLGKFDAVDGLNSFDYIDQMLKDIQVSFNVNPSLSSTEAISYLKGRNVLAVMPSVADNSPLTVHECMMHEIPFLAARAGGIPEVVCRDDHEKALFEPHPVSLALKLEEVLTNGHFSAARPSEDRHNSVMAWAELLLRSLQFDDQERSESPHVTVCITHFERPALLKATLSGLAAQTYTNFDVVIVDDGSRSLVTRQAVAALPLEFPLLNLRIAFQKNLYVGAARNHALSLAEGEYVIFMDDDNYAHPMQLEYFVRAITTSKYDALTCVAVSFPEYDEPPKISELLHLFLPRGSGLAPNLFSNSYGDANGIYRRRSLESVGGFTEDYGTSWEDYELFSKLEIAGYKVGVVPEPLLYLRNTFGSVSRTGSMLPNYFRALRPSLSNLPWKTYGDAILVALSNSFSRYGEFEARQNKNVNAVRRVSNSSDRIFTLRALAHSLLLEGRRDEALRHLLFQIRTSPSTNVLAVEFVFCQLHRSGSKILVKEMRSSVPPIAIAAAAINKFLLSGDLSSIIHEYPLRSENDHPSPDIQYLNGLRILMTGRSVHAVQLWSEMFSEEAERYVARYPDVRDGLETNQLLTPLYHFLKHGRQEGRVFNYEEPIGLPFADKAHLQIDEYFSEISALRNAPLREAAIMAKLLLKRLIEGGSLLMVCDFAQTLKLDFELRYNSDFPDVKDAVARGDFASGLEHWLMHGHTELGRLNLFSEILGGWFGKHVASYCATYVHSKGEDSLERLTRL